MVRTRHLTIHNQKKVLVQLPPAIEILCSFLRDYHTYSHTHTIRNSNHHHVSCVKLALSFRRKTWCIEAAAIDGTNLSIDELRPHTLKFQADWSFKSYPEFLDGSFIRTRDFIEFHSKSPDNISTHHHVVSLTHNMNLPALFLSNVWIRGLGMMWYSFLARCCCCCYHHIHISCCYEMKCEILIIDTQMVSQKDHINPTLVHTS